MAVTPPSFCSRSSAHYARAAAAARRADGLKQPHSKMNLTVRSPHPGMPTLSFPIPCTILLSGVCLCFCAAGCRCDRRYPGVATCVLQAEALQSPPQHVRHRAVRAKRAAATGNACAGCLGAVRGSACDEGPVHRRVRHRRHGAHQGETSCSHRALPPTLCTQGRPPRAAPQNSSHQVSEQCEAPDASCL